MIRRSLLLPGFLMPGLAKACEACKIGQPEILQELTHGTGPQGSIDYLIVGIAVLLVIFTLFYSIKFLVRPGEMEANHIKRTILHFDHHGR